MSRSQTSSTQELTAAEVRAYFDGTKRKFNSGLGHLRAGDRERLVGSTGRRRERCRAPRSHRVGPMRHTATAASTAQRAPPAPAPILGRNAKERVSALVPVTYSGTRNGVKDACQPTVVLMRQEKTHIRNITNKSCALCVLAPMRWQRSSGRVRTHRAACSLPWPSAGRDSTGRASV
jgi:hypothetical protein